MKKQNITIIIVLLIIGTFLLAGVPKKQDSFISTSLVDARELCTVWGPGMIYQNNNEFCFIDSMSPIDDCVLLAGGSVTDWDFVEDCTPTCEGVFIFNTKTAERECVESCADLGGTCSSTQLLKDCVGNYKVSNCADIDNIGTCWLNSEYCQHGCQAGECNDAPVQSCTEFGLYGSCSSTQIGFCDGDYKISHCDYYSNLNKWCWTNEELCENGCENGKCIESVDKACEDIGLFGSCSASQANVCEGDTRFYSCIFLDSIDNWCWSNYQECNNGCENGLCNDEPVTCLEGIKISCTIGDCLGKRTCENGVYGNCIKDEPSCGIGDCTVDWDCTAWSNSTCGTRTCTDSNNCGVSAGKPIESKSCTSECPAFISEEGDDGKCKPSMMVYILGGMLFLVIIFKSLGKKK